jgi:coenzyme PQQ synthesis protein D (PqqD)
MSAPEPRIPASRSHGLVVEHLADETLIYDLERDEAHHLNPTAATVFALCDGHSSAEQLATKVTERLGQPVSAEAVREAVTQLAERGLLAEVPAIEPGVSRREVVRKAAIVGAGAAVAGPIIKTIVAPTPAMAQSRCKSNGQSCNSATECCSGCCEPQGEGCVSGPNQASNKQLVECVA